MTTEANKIARLQRKFKQGEPVGERLLSKLKDELAALKKTRDHFLRRALNNKDSEKLLADCEGHLMLISGKMDVLLALLKEVEGGEVAAGEGEEVGDGSGETPSPSDGV